MRRVWCKMENFQLQILKFPQCDFCYLWLALYNNKIEMDLWDKLSCFSFCNLLHHSVQSWLMRLVKWHYNGSHLYGLTKCTPSASFAEVCFLVCVLLARLCPPFVLNVYSCCIGSISHDKLIRLKNDYSLWVETSMVQTSKRCCFKFSFSSCWTLLSKMFNLTIYPSL